MAEKDRKRQRRRSSNADEKVSGLQVLSISDRQEENGIAHHTEEYESDALVLRRGQFFLIDLILNVAYNGENFHLELKTGRRPSRRSGTLIKILQYSGKEEKDDWYFKIDSKTDSVITLSINIPADVLVSRYTLSAIWYSTENNKRQINEFSHPKTVVILFNAWCEDDEVYMENGYLKEEYVLNDSGSVFWGGRRPKPWFFGQFTDAALQCTFDLLEKIHARRRDTAREVVRHMSAMTNSCNNNGLLTGNWSGDYSGGVKPWKWNGSVKIFKKYLKTQKSVDFGQCWVFSGLMTSMMRALGIPARSVTNYDSAHDTDNNATFDKYFDEDMNYLEEESDDSCWNFHVWNDVWLTRPDLPDGMGGWQAVDGTPQEESRGIYRCGPASLQAIKEGNVHKNYDTRFVFAEVNADQVYWRKSEDSDEEWEVVRIKKDSVGHYISTKAPNRREREDVTNQYKFPEGSLLERAAVFNAMKRSRNPAIRQQANDVKFSSKLPYDVDCDSGVELVIKAKNNSSEELTVDAVVSAQLVRYTGVTLKNLRKQRLSKRLTSKEEYEFVFHFEPSSYVSELDENVTVRLSFMGRVLETRQIYVNQKSCDINKPDLKVELVEERDFVKAGEEITVKVHIPSICSISQLTNCTLEFDGSILADEVEFDIGNLTADGNDIVMKKLVVKKKVKTQKPLELIATLNSRQLSGVTGSLEIPVRNK